VIERVIVNGGKVDLVVWTEPARSSFEQQARDVSPGKPGKTHTGRPLGSRRASVVELEAFA
jgi:hypothetical protein